MELFHLFFPCKWKYQFFNFFYLLFECKDIVDRLITKVDISIHRIKSNSFISKIFSVHNFPHYWSGKLSI